MECFESVKSVKATTYCVCADNLGAHGLAGFNESFNAGKFCRFCTIDRGQSLTVNPQHFQLRTVGQHNDFVREVQWGVSQGVWC